MTIFPPASASAALSMSLSLCPAIFLMPALRFFSSNDNIRILVRISYMAHICNNCINNSSDFFNWWRSCYCKIIQNLLRFYNTSEDIEIIVWFYQRQISSYSNIRFLIWMPVLRRILIMSRSSRASFLSAEKVPLSRHFPKTLNQNKAVAIFHDTFLKNGEAGSFSMWIFAF